MDEMEALPGKLPNDPKPMSGPEAATGNPSSAHEAARFVATVSLSLGALDVQWDVWREHPPRAVLRWRAPIVLTPRPTGSARPPSCGDGQEQPGALRRRRRGGLFRDKTRQSRIAPFGREVGEQPSPSGETTGGTGHAWTRRRPSASPMYSGTKYSRSLCYLMLDPIERSTFLYIADDGAGYHLRPTVGNPAGVSRVRKPRYGSA